MLKKRYFAFLLLVAVAIVLYFSKENLAGMLHVQFPVLTTDELTLMTDIIVALLLAPPAIDILYTRFLLDQNSGLKILE